MKKVKLGVLPYIIVLCCLTFVIVKIRDIRLVETSVQASSVDSLTLIPSEEWNTLEQNTEKIKNETSLLIYDETNDTSVSTYQNIEYVLTTMGVEVVPIKVAEQNKYTDISKYDTMIVCIDSLG